MAAAAKAAAYINRLFINHHLSVITSKKEIRMNEWRKYLIQHWARLVKRNSRILILGGTHGSAQGKVGPVDLGLERDSLNQIDIIRREKAADIETLNIEIIYESLVAHNKGEDNYEVDAETLVEAIMKHKPTLVILAFCFTNKSILNDVFRLHGIYSVLIMQKERDTITHGRCLFLSEQQIAIIREISERRPKNVLLSGFFSTGKTILLMEALRIKIEQLKQEGVDFKVIVTCCAASQKRLLSYLSETYSFPGVDVTFLEDIEDLKCEEEKTWPRDDKYVAYPYNNISHTFYGVKDVRQMIDYLEAKFPAKRIVLAVDEVRENQKHSKEEWSEVALGGKRNTDLLLSFIPDKHWARQLCPQTEKDGSLVTLFCQLDRVYRNSAQVFLLISFLSTHDSDHRLPPVTSASTEDDLDLLPVGRTPVWVKVRDRDTYITGIWSIHVLDYVEKNDILEGESASFLFDNGQKRPAEQKWLEDRGYKFYNTETADSMNGLEDEVIVFLSNGGRPLKVDRCLEEAVTRARKTVVVVMNLLAPTQSRQVLQMAADHARVEQCGVEEDCPHLQIEILKIDKIESPVSDSLNIPVEPYNGTRTSFPEIDLSPQQKNILKAVVEEKPRNILLCGHLGTGKSSILLECFKIKLRQYQSNGESLRVVVIAGAVLRHGVLEHVQDSGLDKDIVDYYPDMSRVSPDLDLIEEASDLVKLAEILAKYHQGKKVILMIDDICSEEKDFSLWENMESKERIDFLLAFSPYEPVIGIYYQDAVPTSPNMTTSDNLVCKLSTIFRNSYEVLRLCSYLLFKFLQQHYPKIPLENIKNTKDKLPLGRMPIWIEFEDFDDSDNSSYPTVLFQHIKDNYLEKEESATFVFLGHPTSEEEHWIRENGFRLAKYACDEGKYQDEVIVFMLRKSTTEPFYAEQRYLLEVISLAVKTAIVVTAKGARHAAAVALDNLAMQTEVDSPGEEEDRKPIRRRGRASLDQEGSESCRAKCKNNY